MDKIKKPKEKNMMRRLYIIVKPFTTWLVIGILFFTVESVAKIALNEVMGQGLDSVVSNTGIEPNKALIYIITLAVISGIGSAVTTYARGRFGTASMFKVTQETIKKIKRLPLSFIERHTSGEFVSKINNDLDLVRQFVDKQFEQLIVSSLFFVMLSVYYLVKNFKLGLTMLIVIGVIIPFFQKALNKLFHSQAQALEKTSDSASLASDSMQGIREVKAFNKQDEIKETFNENVDKETDANINTILNEINTWRLSQVFGYIPDFVLFVVGGYLALNGECTIGTIFAFKATNDLFRRNIFSSTHCISVFVKCKATLVRVFDIWDQKSEDEVWTDSKKDNNNVDDEGYAFQFKNVDFAYPTQELLAFGDDKEQEVKNVLKNINIDINKGETIAFVGRSGCGKSTILKLMSGFYHINSGSIYKNGTDISNLTLDELRHDLSIVSQDSFLFPVTIHNNIAYGRGKGIKISDGENMDIDVDEKILNAAKAANIDEFVKSKPKGYQSLVGERGLKLSGGQKQRVAIARSVIKDAQILLLDEPTSALDTESENIVQQALDNITKDKTCVVVAHRLSSIKNANRIYVLDEGEIIEVGTHKELVEKEGLYYQLYKSQLKERSREYA